MPQAIDIVFFIAAAAIVIAETKRGFGRALLDFVTLYGALLASNAAAPFLAQHAGFSPMPSMNAGWSFGVCFTAFGVVALTVSRVAYQVLNPDFGLMDTPLGAFAGFALAVLVLHGFAILLNFGSAGVLAGSSLGSEALDFKTYHTIVDGFTSLGNRPSSYASG